VAKPELVQYSFYKEPVCCQYELPKKKKGQAANKIPGMKVFLKVSYRGKPGAPVTLVWGSDEGGSAFFDSAELSKDKQDKSEKGSITCDFEICLPCSAYRRGATGYTVHFELHAKDNHKKASRDIVGYYIGSDHFNRLGCCPAVAPPPKRPIRGD
jgi:hypothetical protein